jgi:hypothetical protein
MADGGVYISSYWSIFNAKSKREGFLVDDSTVRYVKYFQGEAAICKRGRGCYRCHTEYSQPMKTQVKTQQSLL